MTDPTYSFEAIDEMDADELVIRLERFDDAYYNTGQPLVEDWLYDQMKDRLRALNPDEPYLKKVGAKPSSAWKKVAHQVPMGSLSKAQNLDELLKLFGGAEQVSVLSEKLDGMSLSVRYEDGKLVLGSTRGDGSEGEDITRNVLKMKGIKPSLGNLTGNLRGEVVVLRSDFQAHFASNYVNERNTANGVSKRLDGEGCQYLSVFFYQILLDDPEQQAKLTSKVKEFTLIEKLGLSTPFWAKVENIDAAEKIYQDYIETTRAALDYLIDGLVLEVNDRDVFDEMGDNNEGRPKGAIAYKFPHETAKSRAKEIVWQVGQVGNITPVAMLEPTFCAGVTVSQASLYNVKYIKEIGLTHLDCPVTICRRNDVIPRVDSVDGDGKGAEVKIPENCPSCDQPLHMEGEILKCGNKTGCPAQVRGVMERWIDACGLNDWGVSALNALMDEHGVEQPADLYRVTEDQLAELMLKGRKLGASMAAKMIQGRDARKSLTLGAAVGAMGIPMCAKDTCETLVASGLNSVEKLAAATVDDLTAIRGIGESKAAAFVANFPRAKAFLDALLSEGFEIREGGEGGLVGMTFCFTGFRDADLHRQVEEAGGIMKSGVSKKLTHLVADNPNGTSGKLRKARDYGIKIIGKDDLQAMLR